jgi:ribose 5-phosphate isomerase A
MTSDTAQNQWKQEVGEAAASYIQPGMLVGLGTGSTATQFIEALGRRVQQGLILAGVVPSSNATEQLAQTLGLPLTTLDAHPELDIALDGADEIDDRLNLIKGGGGALLREKIVATAAKRFIVLGDITKQVQRLGTRSQLPVEFIPFAATPIRYKLERLGIEPRLRMNGQQAYLTDNGNMIYDCSFSDGILDPERLQSQLHTIVGVVETGLFLGIAAEAMIGGPDGITVIKKV